MHLAATSPRKMCSQIANLRYWLVLGQYRFASSYIDIGLGGSTGLFPFTCCKFYRDIDISANICTRSRARTESRLPPPRVQRRHGMARARAVRAVSCEIMALDHPGWTWVVQRRDLVAIITALLFFSFQLMYKSWSAASGNGLWSHSARTLTRMRRWNKGGEVACISHAGQ